VSRGPEVVVTVGGGGVGKTTTSVALALASARSGRRTLLVTIDPARRLAGVLGVPLGPAVVDVPGAHGARLAALMPDARGSMRAFIDDLFEEEQEARAHLLQNRLFVALSDAVAGVHELVAMSLVARAAASGEFDRVVIDTAPSRHALDFVAYPARLAALLGGKTVTWFAGVAERAARSAPTARSGVLSWGAGRVEALLAKITGPHLLSDTASLFGDLARVRERFLLRTRDASDVLLGDATAFVVVTAPTPAALDDARFLDQRLTRLHRPPAAFLMNRAADDGALAKLATLGEVARSPELRAALDSLEREERARAELSARFLGELQGFLRGRPLVALPTHEAASPREVATRLAGDLGRSGVLERLGRSS
jgi:anion-transporting  ArsA/GET3 family ATPase